MAHVTKPCPACKTTDHIRDSATDICRHCKKEFEFARVCRQRDAKIESEKGDVEVVTISTYYGISGYYHHPQGALNHVAQERLQKAIFQILLMLGHNRIENDYPGDLKKRFTVPKLGNRDRAWEYYRSVQTMQKTHADAFNELDEAIRDAIKVMADEAYENGRNLLLSIAGGHVSMNELNEKHTKKG